MDLLLKNKVAVITGSSQGIGAATVELLAEHGAAVVVNYRKNRKEAQKVVNSILKKRASPSPFKPMLPNQQILKDW